MNHLVNLSKYEKITFIFQNLQVLIALVGITGNVLSYVVFLRKPLRNQSYSFYFRIISWTDSLVLLHLFRHWFRVVLGIDLNLLGPIFCRFDEYQPYVAASTSFWLRTLILFDRLIRLAYHQHLLVLRRKWFQLTSVLLIIAFNCLLHIILPLNYRLETTERSDNSTLLVCHLPPKILGINLIYVIVNLSIWSICTFIFEFKLVFFVFKLGYRVRNSHNASTIKDRKFAISSMIISFVNVFCLFTFIITSSIAILLRLEPDLRDLMFTLGITVSNLNFVFVFFINLFVNSIFYNEFLSLFGIKNRQNSED